MIIPYKRRQASAGDWSHVQAQVLEHDQTYADNLKALIDRVRQGKVSRESYTTLQKSLAAAAMRRHSRAQRNQPQLLAA